MSKYLQTPEDHKKRLILLQAQLQRLARYGTAIQIHNKVTDEKLQKLFWLFVRTEELILYTATAASTPIPKFPPGAQKGGKAIVGSADEPEVIISKDGLIIKQEQKLRRLHIAEDIMGMAKAALADLEKVSPGISKGKTESANEALISMDFNTAPFTAMAEFHNGAFLYGGGQNAGRSAQKNLNNDVLKKISDHIKKHR